MKLKYQLNIIDMDNEKVAVPICDGENQFRGVLRINETTEFILNLLKEETTTDNIIDKMLEEYDTTREVLENNVDKIISTLKENNLIE
ncbi:MAG: PqqD family protein [Firmicutes bacterium]|nr:PqqD family protein [Candidatus Caballimonas caccae]